MRKITLAALLLLLAVPAWAAKLNIKAGSTDVSLVVFVQNSSVTTGAGLTGVAYNASGLVCYYVRPGSAAAQLTLATQTVTGAHSDGGWVEVDATNMPGVYRLDLSDTIVGTGVRSAVVACKGATNMAPVVLEIDLNSEVNTVALSGTAQTARDIGASVLLSSGTGTGQVSLSSGTVTASLANGSHGGAAASLTLGGGASISSSSGSALTISSTGGNGHGIVVTGNGTGEGISSTGGASGAGIAAIGGATAGGYGIYAQGSSSSTYGIYGVGTGATESGGIKGVATTSGEGIEGVAAGNGHGLYVVGAGTGEGLHATGGSGNTGDGATFEAGSSATNGAGARFIGVGGGSSHGAVFTRGGTSSDDIYLTNSDSPTLATQIVSAGAITTSSGAVSSVTTVGSVTGAVGSVTGNVGGNVTGSVGSVTGNVGGSVASVTGAVGSVTGAVGSVTNAVTVGAMNTAALADLFDTDSGTTYGAAVAGSVVKEIADNSGGGGSNPWATALPGAYSSGEAGYILGNLIDTLNLQHGPGPWAK